MKKMNKKGFTLIEVVLVLAIGGLIFLLAFLAFQQVSTNRRDTQRRSDASRVLAELANAEGDTMKVTGAASLGDFIAAYLGGTDAGNAAVGTSTASAGSFTSNGITYTVYYQATAAPKATGNGVASMNVSAGSCAAGGSITGSAGNAVSVGLEKGVVCRDDK